MLTWAHRHGIALRLIEPGKPNQNAYIEAFNGRFRAAVPQAASRVLLAIAEQTDGSEQSDPAHACFPSNVHASIAAFTIL
jgi:transposase InsO family protein